MSIEQQVQQAFCLDRAKAGDIVEQCNEYGNWSICTSKTFEKVKFPLIRLDNGFCISEFNLRHKYPRMLK